MIFSENGDFSYYIGIGVGGEGTYTLQGNKIFVNMSTYEEGEYVDENFLFIEENGKKYVVKDDCDYLIYWYKQ